MNPPKEGRCVRCLEQGHVARECRDPIKCQLCRQGGHSQASCRLQQNQKTDAAGTGFFACLVGDLSGADASWAHILDGIQATCPNLTTPNCHRLVSGEIFIRGLSKRNWQRLHGQSARLPVGGAIRWRRPRPTDAAFSPLKVVKRVEVRGVPFGLRKWHHMEQLIRQAGALRKFVCNGLQSGDPNCICLDVEMEADTAVPRKILVTEGTGAGTEILQAVLPPPPPPLHHLTPCPHLASSSESTVALAEKSAGDKQKHPTQSTSDPPQIQHQSPTRNPSDLQITQAHIEGATETSEHIIRDPILTPDTDLTARGDGPRDSLLLYCVRRRSQKMPVVAQNGELSTHEKHLEAIGGAEAQETPAAMPEEPLILASVVLLPLEEVARDMEVGNGVLPSPP